MKTSKIIAVVGPTGSGKSALGAYLAHKLGGETISADSRQVYRGMRVISRAERGNMVGIADPRRQFSAGAYKKYAEKLLKQIRVPIVVGGTGFYIDLLLGRMHAPEVPPNKKLRAALAKLSNKQLLARLRKLNPKRAAEVDPHNKVRLVRAIEVAKGVAEQKVLNRATDHASRRPKERGEKLFAKPKVLWLGLKQPKNLRAGVETRLRDGMVAEARALRKSLPRRRYSELGFEFNALAEYLDKKISKTELVDKIANGERKYALRQMRWFKRNKSIRWVSSKSEALWLAKKFLKS